MACACITRNRDWHARAVHSRIWRRPAQLEPQVRAFSRRYRCITYNARGYPPSEVPQSVDAYGQKQAADDALAVLDHLKIDKAHICGLSMGGYAALHFGIRFPQRARSLAICGAGHGSDPSTRDQFLKDAEELASA